MDEAIGNVLLNQQARPRATHLTLVKPDGIHHALYSAIEISVLEDDEGGLATQLKG